MRGVQPVFSFKPFWLNFVFIFAPKIEITYSIYQSQSQWSCCSCTTCCGIFLLFFVSVGDS